jgi:hypothetical protein
VRGGEVGWTRVSGFCGWTWREEVAADLKVSLREDTMVAQTIEVDCLSFVAAAAAGAVVVVVWQ